MTSVSHQKGWKCLFDFTMQSILSKNDTKSQFILFLPVFLSPLFNLCSYTLIVHKRYQEKEELTSSIRISLKGVAHADRIWDAAEYTLPTQASLNLESAQYSNSVNTSGFFPGTSAGMSSNIKGDLTFETAMF